MAEIRQVTEAFAVAPQLNAADFKAIAAAGFKSVINNRPDGEAPDQVSAGEGEARALAAGLVYRSIPFAGPPGPEHVAAMSTALEALPGPVLAYCRTGTRSITVWALSQARAGKDSAELIALAKAAGYDLAALKSRLDQGG